MSPFEQFVERSLRKDTFTILSGIPFFQREHYYKKMCFPRSPRGGGELLNARTAH